MHQVCHLADVATVTVADFTDHDSVTAMALAALEGAPRWFCLAGLSMGGYVAQEIMRIAPERVLKLALLNTSGRADTSEQAARRRGLSELVGKGSFKGVTPRLLPLLVLPVLLSDEALTATITAMAAHVGKAAFLRQQRAVMARTDGRDDLGRVPCPTLVVAGREDALVPVEAAREIALFVPAAELVVIEDCGHLLPQERPQAVTALMRRWLLYA